MSILLKENPWLYVLAVVISVTAASSVTAVAATVAASAIAAAMATVAASTAVAASVAAAAPSEEDTRGTGSEKRQQHQHQALWSRTHHFN